MSKDIDTHTDMDMNIVCDDVHDHFVPKSMSVSKSKSVFVSVFVLMFMVILSCLLQTSTFST
jgi:hypothetical protein